MSGKRVDAVAFVMYHYTYAEPLFAIIQVFVSAYVWMTGFGNGIFFWSKSDFSAKRFFQCIWRINFLVIPLSLVTKTPWILYYVVALHTTHFVLIYLCLAAAKSIALKLRWRKQGENVFATWSERLVGIVIYFVVILVFWDVPAVYTVAIDMPLRAILGIGFADYFQVPYVHRSLVVLDWVGVRSGLPCHKEELHSKKLGPVESGEMAVLFILHDNARCRLLVPLAHTFPPPMGPHAPT